jgi:hypothetical protein
MKYYSGKKIPDFKDLESFVVWYVENNMPLLPPKNYEVFLSDDATASCLFRHKQYQVEMYLIHPNPVIPIHEHPGVENFEVPQGSWQDINFDLIQTAGQSHGIGFKERAKNSGFILYSAQKWDDGLELSTIGARWKGHTAGPKHEALIKRFNPKALIYPGYADVTKEAVQLSIL